MKFVKMQGLGNDFVFLDHLERLAASADYPELARRMCDRHFGIGADGLIIVLPSTLADAQMRIYNADGSEAEMCGNGIRCFARYLYDAGYVNRLEQRIETLAGVLSVRLHVRGEDFLEATVDMGEPIFAPERIPVRAELDPVVNAELTVEGQNVHFTALSMGNPHCVIFVEDVDQVDLAKLGRAIERHPLFPRQTNVEFVRVDSPQEITMRVWERGAGATLACGTGACAALIAAALSDRTKRQATVHLPGGDLTIEWRIDRRVYLTGPAEYVCSGEYLVEG
ncbi:MAG: diaminopimelate epimerase [Peptococcaceae bacterium]|jgi:diaminopimelate epimerase|nr:diaminopimelate epimerase [Peptococcaceae bacterium]